MELMVKGADALTVSETTFGREFNEALVHQVVVAYAAGARQGTRAQKTRSEVSGGGAKPWRQKGTGRARFGSSRNPIWRHGGVAFGPTGEENYTKNMPKSMVRSSIKQALSLKSQSIKVVESYSVAEYKTKKVIEILDSYIIPSMKHKLPSPRKS